MKSLLVATLAVLFFGVFQSPLHADKYDDELRLQRDAKRLQDMWDAEDKRGRDAALLRERGGLSSSSGEGFRWQVFSGMALVSGAIFAFFYFVSQIGEEKPFSHFRSAVDIPSSPHPGSFEWYRANGRLRDVHGQTEYQRVQNAKAAAAEERDKKTRQKNQDQLDELMRREIGEKLEGLIATISKKSRHSIDVVANLIRSESEVPFVMQNGHVLISLEQARKIERFIPEIQAQCDAINTNTGHA